MARPSRHVACSRRHRRESGLNERLNPHAAGVAIGRVASLHLRRNAFDAPAAVDAVQALAGLGLEGDIQQHALSPRQLLIAGVPAYARLGLPANALRENLLLDVDVDSVHGSADSNADSGALVSGRLLAVGAGAIIQLTFACEPCGRLNLRQDRLSQAIGLQRGMLARVLAGGAIVTGDPVFLLPQRMPSWSNGWRDRVETVLARVPRGMVVEYRQLALLAGVALTYCRVFPRVARELGLAHVAVPLRSDNPLPRWDGAGLFD
jgi:hypothetical protein